MKAIVKSIGRVKVIDVRDTFVVLLGISIVLCIVVILDYYHLIKAYSWQ